MKPEEISKRNAKNYVGQVLAVFSSTGMIAIITTYLSFVYTMYMGLSAATVGLVLAIGIVVDGLSDFGMGLLMDHTHSKYGKARPWFRRMAFPIAISMSLIFLTPQGLSTQAKTIWLFVTYNLYCTMLTAARIPATSLVSLISDNEKTRRTSSFISGLASQIGNTIATTLIGILVTLFGGGLFGYQATNVLFSVTIALSLISSFYLIREVDVDESAESVTSGHTAEPEKRSVITDVKLIFKNKYWIIQELAELTVNLGTGFLTGTMAYFCNFVLGNMAVTMSVMAAVLSFSMLAGIIFWGAFGNKIDAPRLTSICCIFAAAGYVVSCVGWWGFNSVFLVYTGLAIKQFFSGPYMITGPDLTARTVVYGEWKSGVRQDGLCYSGKSVLQKICAALASAIVGFLLTSAGYAGGTELAPSTVDAIARMFLMVPIAFWLLASVCYSVFRLDNDMVSKMSSEIDERRIRTTEP